MVSPKKMLFLIVPVSMLLIPMTGRGQTIQGTWQLVKTANCMDEKIQADSDAEQELVDEMKGLSGPSSRVVRFKDKGAGEETTRILNRKKTVNGKNFLYKINGETLLILDKRSQTISDSYSIDKLSRDSLILSNATRACEIRFFVKIKDRK
jgi:hypothetical protein